MVDTYHIELAKDEHACKGICTIANEFGISNQYCTITNRAQGYQSATEFAKEQQKVTVAEEVILVNFILESAGQGFPMTHKQIEEYANLILWNHIGLEYKPVGKNWVHRFIDRHHEQLQTHWTKPLDTQRAQSMTPKAKKQWFELVENFVVKVGIHKEDTYGIDETGCPPRDLAKEKVLGLEALKHSINKAVQIGKMSQLL